MIFHKLMVDGCSTCNTKDSTVDFQLPLKLFRKILYLEAILYCQIRRHFLFLCFIFYVLNWDMCHVSGKVSISWTVSYTTYNT